MSIKKSFFNLELKKLKKNVKKHQIRKNYF